MAEITLLSLPLEVIWNISRLLPSTDYLNLRVTCRSMENMLFDQFVKEFFAIRQIFRYKPSLRNLIDISNHPQLRLAVDKVIFCNETISPMNRFEYLEEDELHLTDRSDEMLQECKDYVNSGEIVTDLVTALSQLPNLRILEEKNYIGQGLHRRDGTQIRSYGVYKFKRENPDYDVYAIKRFVKDTAASPSASILLPAIIEASKSGLKLIAFNSINRRGGFNHDDLKIPEDKRQEYKAAFANLTTLMMNAEPDLDETHLEDFLDIMPNLIHLRVNAGAQCIVYEYVKFFDVIKMRSLKKLELSWPIMSVNTLKDILVKQDQLEHLTLHRIHIGSCHSNDFVEILELFREMKLTSLSLSFPNIHFKGRKNEIRSHLILNGTIDQVHENLKYWLGIMH